MKPFVNEAFDTDRVDLIGSVASSLCALHCAICALIPTTFGALGLGFLLTQQTEWTLSIVATAFAISAGYLGWRVHRSTLVVAVLTLGIAGLMTSRSLEMDSHHHDHHGESHSEEMEHTATEKVHSDHGVQVHKEGFEKSNEYLHDTGSEAVSMHSLGSIMGVLGGILLFIGHMLNIRTSHRFRKECCD